MLFLSAIVSIMYQASLSGSPSPAFIMQAKRLSIKSTKDFNEIKKGNKEIQAHK